MDQPTTATDASPSPEEPLKVVNLTNDDSSGTKSFRITGWAGSQSKAPPMLIQINRPETRETQNLMNQLESASVNQNEASTMSLSLADMLLPIFVGSDGDDKSENNVPLGNSL